MVRALLVEMGAPIDPKQHLVNTPTLTIGNRVALNAWIPVTPS
jgi:hypothetical protein